MPTFTYSARTPAGAIQTGEIDLPSRDEVNRWLARQRMIPIKVADKNAGLNIEIKFGTGIKTRDIVILTRQFATMINSALPLVQSLDILAKQSQNPASR